MAIDLKHLREHYASLSDEALREVAREDLVEAAQRCYDEEVAHRRMKAPRTAAERDGAEEEADFEDPDVSGGEETDWLEEASEVCSYAVHGAGPAPAAAEARNALKAAGIPCVLELTEIPREERGSHREPTHHWRLLAPGKLTMQASSVLERDIFNPEFEAQWRTHLETLSDEDVLAMNPETAFCGLFDRIERVTRVYADELERRGLAEEGEPGA